MNFVLLKRVTGATTAPVILARKRALNTPAKPLTKATASAAAYALMLIFLNATVIAQVSKDPTKLASARVPKSQAANGDKFVDITDVKVADRLFAEKKWTDEDYEAFYDFRIAQQEREAVEHKAIIAQKEKEAVERKAIIAQKERSGSVG